MTGDWDTYAEALRVLGRAPVAAQEKLTRIAQAQRGRAQAADEVLRATLEKHQQLERRLNQVTGLGDKILFENAVPANGPVDHMPVPAPTDAAACLTVLDTLEHQLRGELQRLLTARNPPPAPTTPPRLLIAMTVAAVALVSFVVLILIIT